MRAFAVLMTSLTLAACSLAPRYSRPPTPAPPAAYQELDGWKRAEPADAQNRGQWWAIFQDPTLDSLEDRIGTANQDIKAALARLQQARAQTRIARAAYYPTLTVGPNATRSKVSVNAPNYAPGEARITNDFALDADLSYEADVWGRVRSSVASAKASEQASAADLATLDLSIRAELASDYFTLRGEDTQQVLLDRTVEDYARSLPLYDREALRAGARADGAPVRRGRGGARRCRSGQGATRVGA